MTDTTAPLETLDAITERHRRERSDLKSRHATERYYLYAAMRERKAAVQKRPVGRPRKDDPGPRQYEYRDGEKREIM